MRNACQIFTFFVAALLVVVVIVGPVSHALANDDKVCVLKGNKKCDPDACDNGCNADSKMNCVTELNGKGTCTGGNACTKCVCAFLSETDHSECICQKPK